jgi:alpha-glucosidase
MVGSDVCGFNNNTWETICARWAMLGAFSPFYRNHADISASHQEFYLWPTVAEAAKIAIDARFRLLDYIYTAFHRQTQSGSPLITPLWFKYPNDANTFPIDMQYFYGDSVLVSPVTGDEATSVDIYLPNDIFYDFWTSQPVLGKAATVTLTDVPFTSIPLHIRGGSVVPLRVSGTNTTTELRKKDFYLIIALGLDGKASGGLYLDDGESVNPSATTEIQFSYDGSQLSCDGTFDYDPGVQISYVVLLGAASTAKADGHASSYSPNNQTLTVDGPFSLKNSWTLRVSRS